MVTDVEWPTADELADPLCLPLCALLVCIAQQDRELLTAVSCEDVFLSDLLLYAAHKLTEDTVADGVSVGVVDMFEVVNVKEYHREGDLVTGGEAPLFFDVVEKVAAIVCAC